MPERALLHHLLELQVGLDMRDDRQALLEACLKAFVHFAGARSGALLGTPEPGSPRRVLYTDRPPEGLPERIPEPLDPRSPVALPGRDGEPWLLFPLRFDACLLLHEARILSPREQMDLQPALDFLGTLLGRVAQCSRINAGLQATAMLNRVLTAAHRISRLVATRGEDPDLLSRACGILVDSGVTPHALIRIYDDRGTLVGQFDSGQTPGSGSLPCLDRLAPEGVHHCGPGSPECRECPLEELHSLEGGLCLALLDGSRVLGHLVVALASLNGEDERRRELLQTMATELAVAVRNQRSRELHRGQAALLARRQQAQDLLIRVSADLLAIQREEGSAAITRVMGHLARFGQGDRAYIFRLDQGGDTVTNTHEWCDKGITPQQEQLQAVPVSLFEWWMERMYRGEPIHLASLDDLPPEAADGREMLASQGIHSLVALPLRDGQRLLGFLGIDWVRRPTTLEPELVSMLQLGANLIRNSLERQRVLEELETSRQKMELALRGADQGTWNWYPETGRLEVDERWCTMLGLIPDQVPPVISSWENRLHPEDRSRVLALLGEVLDGHNDSYETRHRLRNADGHWIWVLAKGRVMERGPEGRPLRMSGTHLDVSQQERSSRIWRSAFHHSSQLMALTTATDRRFLEVNRAFLQTLGLQRDEVLGRTTEELGLEGAEGLGERIQEQFRREGVVRDFEVSLRARDGRVIQGLFSIDPVELEDDQPCLISSVTDITGLRQAEQHRQQAEASLWQAQKLESIGLLAGGVAHDFNNLLGIIMGYAEMMLEEDQDRGTASRLGSIVEAVERAQALTRQLLMFSRKQVISPRPVAVNRLIENALKMYRRLIGEDIRLHFEPGDELPEVMADPQQLEQVLANLLINARDGIHALGTDRTGAVIRVSTCMEHLEAGNSQSGAHPAGDYLCLEVQDSGCGMEPAVIERIFDPFFTTKALGKGTGLGLATVLGVVSQNAGVIQVHSRPGEGACFRIHWPAIARAEQPGEALVRSRDLPGGSEHILLVEDEPTLLELGRKLLSRKGYSVSPAASAEQAVALAQGLHHPPDLLVTDLVLPGINGRQLAEALQERWPQLRVLYTSGYTHDILDRYDLDRDGHELLHKPYSMADLLSRVRTLLDGE